MTDCVAGGRDNGQELVLLSVGNLLVEKRVPLEDFWCCRSKRNEDVLGSKQNGAQSLRWGPTRGEEKLVPSRGKMRNQRFTLGGSAQVGKGASE